MLINPKKALILAPHTDDGELGCGGTIAKLIERGTEVYYAAFSIARDSVPKDFPEDILATEVKAATSALGIPEKNLFVFDYPVRKLNYHRQEILEDLVKIRNNIKPDLIFTPSPADIHQDHEVISRETIRAFKQNCVLGYELLWNNIDFKLTCISELEQQHIDLKIKALLKYESQQKKDSIYMNRDFIEANALVRGAQIGKKYAEAFEVMRWVI